MKARVGRDAAPAHSSEVGLYRGISLLQARAQDVAAVLQRLAALQIDQYVIQYAADRHTVGLCLHPDMAQAWAPDSDTLQLSRQLRLHPFENADDLEREILLAMLLSPVALEFPSARELLAAVRIRRNIVQAARKTALNFSTEAAERPEAYWTYDEERGFILLPGKPLIDALVAATQPDASGKCYSFSCYRATEYIILLGIAQEIAHGNPVLYAQLQRQWEQRAIMSGRFHEVFLREYGSMEEPLPVRYYVPGDRVWFRNPDPHSSDVTGYEGSWVMYLGSGQFSNFWEAGRTYTLDSKCLELFHWRNAIYRDAAGELQMDEQRVAALVEESLNDPVHSVQILAQMQRLRDPQGVYQDGGCLDATRESPRRVCPGSSELVLPNA
ncbi:MAG TPA: hypothetical protein VFR06_00415 [Gallionellaceae bacterium]|nr:hypothetical protein [Gallionellaceae bacterium]